MFNKLKDKMGVSKETVIINQMKILGLKNAVIEIRRSMSRLTLDWFQ